MNIEKFFDKTKKYLQIAKQILLAGKYKKSLLLFILLLLGVAIWNHFQYRKTCRGFVEISIRTKTVDYNAQKIIEVCAAQAKTGDYRELYAYYGIYRYVDQSFQDKMENNKYHWMLFYANQNSRDFDSQTQSFKKENGLYEEELKSFEEQMTQEEKIKSFHYIADNLATGKEGWVKRNDYHQSFEYLKKAADAGDVESQGALAEAYFLGQDRYNKFKIKKDYKQAYAWLYISTKHSTQKSYHNRLLHEALKIVSAEMDKEEIKEAQNISKLWLTNNRNFIQSHPPKIVEMTKSEITKVQNESEKFIQDYNLNQPTPTTNSD